MTQRRRALVTGASAGIGTAIAEELASRGFDLVLTARRQDRLDEVKSRLATEHGVDARAIAADLADPAAPAQVFAATEADGLAIDVLVNNAGYGVPGEFLSSDWSVHRDFIQVMMTAVCHLTHLYLPGMIERRYGRVMQVASLAGMLPGSAGHTLYGASKAFLIRMAESLAHEVEGHGVHVTALCPGLTRSEFHDVTGTRDIVGTLPTWMWQDAAVVARQGVDAVMRGDAVYINGGVNRVMSLAARYLPRRVSSAMVRRSSSRFRRR